LKNTLFVKIIIVAALVFVLSEAGGLVVFGQDFKYKGPQTYYVSPYGNNMDPGNEEKPWASPGFASKKLKPGDTLVVLSGRYTINHNNEVISPPSGRSGAWITIKGDEKGRPIIYGDGGILAPVNIAGRSYVRIENFEITSKIENPYNGGAREGVEAGGSYTGYNGYVSNIVLYNLEIHNVEETGVRLAGSCRYVMMEKLNVHHTGRNCIDAPSAGGAAWHNVVLLDSYLGFAGQFSKGQSQPSSYKMPDGIRTESPDGPLEIKNCIIEHNIGDGIDSRCKNTSVINTIVANNGADNLKFRGIGSRAENTLIYGDGDGNAENGTCGNIVIDSKKPGKYEFVNVTVDDNPGRQAAPVYIQQNSKVPITLVLRNCIFAHSHSEVFLGDLVTLKADHNIFYRIGQAYDYVLHAGGKDYLPADLGTIGKGNFSADPLFKNPAWGERGDYSLLPGSPAIDAGTDQGTPKTDLEGKIRPRGKAPDLGCYETRR
jgi:hypothetical protein